ncbi:tautomerase family protein [Zavarzinia aquatilis]|uniref:Tautomerase enzyme n=1 Tax=Zavarzinia aquatilis TaxID=2211142 RepID=A0A317EFI6_9PROT|nr:tautomerase enzyme [Zavarzinia aquatilis]PWR24153.1 tautomerase enzyme [Zavarzinia aquatilis]
MTIIRVTAPDARLTAGDRARLAEVLTDAVLVPEVGQKVAAARVGFQVQFTELPRDHMAIGGKLLSAYPIPLDVITFEIKVMAAAWPAEVRREVIRNILNGAAEVLGLPEPPPTWWVTFQIIDEGSWGSRGDVLSILDLLDSGVFTPARIEAIRRALC